MITQRKITCNHCGTLHTNVLALPKKVQCVSCHKWIDEAER